MCGRYTTEMETDERELLRILARADAQPRHADAQVPPLCGREVFPSDTAAVLAMGQDGRTDAFLFRWGFGAEIDGKERLLINARSESIGQRAMFAPHWEGHRCVIPTAGFYEWAHVGGRADPGSKYRFNLVQTGILYLAGLYRPSSLYPGEWEFVILTRAAGDSMAPIHDRMPVVLRREHIEEYLVDERSARMLLSETPPVLVKRLVS